MQAIRTFLRNYWPEALLLLLLLLILPPFIRALASLYAAGAQVITAVGSALRVPQETINKIVDTVGQVAVSIMNALDHPAAQTALAAVLFFLRPVLGLFVGALIVRDWIFGRGDAVNVITPEEAPSNLQRLFGP